MLSPKAEQKIEHFFNLPFKGVLGVRCPYYNNTRSRERGQLRVLVGKGSPEEIVEEAQIISIHYHKGLFDRNGNCCLHDGHDGHDEANAETIRAFLIDYRLGIECSGFVTHVLQEHFLETKGVSLINKLYISSLKDIFRWAISKLRPIENSNVQTFADPKNSTPLVNAKGGYDYAKLLPGDLIIMLETGLNNRRNHIILIRDINDGEINYVHARAWSSEGTQGHGVTAGKITITNPKGTLLDQTWEEKGLIDERNETFLEAKRAQVLEIRRLTI